VEDAVLINEGAIQRGLFQVTYYSTYEAHESREEHADGSRTETHFTDSVTRPSEDTSKLDDQGVVYIGTAITDNMALMGMVSTTMVGKNTLAAHQQQQQQHKTITPKKGQLGIVDRVFLSDAPPGERLAKVRIRETRVPEHGDKIASRAGQKGVIGLVVREEDMPFTKEGLRPDIIMNPHAFPSRQTVGQMIEMVVGKLAVMQGTFGDCTAFEDHGVNIEEWGRCLNDVSFHSSGNEILYNGMTGEQMESEIFIGPAYYMRLKHMVKDKINYRARGPREAMTRQPVSGRANDGGLRIGEMERDCLLAHGSCDFLRESFMERSDPYRLAICHATGAVAIHHVGQNTWLSPQSDGPVEFRIDANENMTLETKTVHGREFSLVHVPFSMKQFLLELGALGIQMRIVPENAVSQMQNMTAPFIFPTPPPPKLTRQDNRDELLRPRKFVQQPPLTDSDLEDYDNIWLRPRQEDPTQPSSPPPPPSPSPPSDSSEYDPSFSPLPGPENWQFRQKNSDSPEYAPYSPAYVPNSPVTATMGTDEIMTEPFPDAAAAAAFPPSSAVQIFIQPGAATTTEATISNARSVTTTPALPETLSTSASAAASAGEDPFSFKNVTVRKMNDAESK